MATKVKNGFGDQLKSQTEILSERVEEEPIGFHDLILTSFFDRF
jgi:hypothetical protein